MSRKFYITLTITVLALSGISVYGLIGSRRVAASTSVSATSAVQTLPSLYLYTLTTDNVINVVIPGTTVYFGLGRVSRAYGSLIGIDFRPADPVRTNLYALTDQGRVIVIDLNNISATPRLLGTLSPNFAGGFQSLFDFNPVVDAIRIIGSNRQNYAVVSANGGLLNTTAVQTAVAYAAGDVNAAQTPYLCGGAYTNNVAGAATTIFYAFDYNTDQFVTVPIGANGSSATGGGQLQTIGSVINQFGNRVRFNPVADFDITTDAYGRNLLIGVTASNSMVIIDLSQINPSLPIGRTQTVVARTTDLLTLAGDMPIDFAIQLRPATVASR